MRLTEHRRRVYRNDFATRCFRNVADEDYIAARTSYRFGLVEPFLWSSLQAVEKYVKAILLYNDCSTKGINHDVEKGFNRLSRIGDIEFDLHEDVSKFIHYLSRHASSRYLERPYYTMGRELLRLDNAVWNIRRYCQDLRSGPSSMSESTLLEIHLRSIARSRWSNKPHRFRLFGDGFLERVVDGRVGSEVREALIWKNPYYGKRYRRRLRNYKLRSQSENPPHFRHKESYFAVKDLVFFSKEIRNEMESS